jgi:Uma2 family endonuclease
MTSPIEQYLNTSYHPDCEFVDGLIVERNLGERTHSAAQRGVIVYFKARSAEYRIKVFPGVRVQVSPTRIRVPDVTVIKSSQFQGEIFTAPPHLCVEILSKDDTMEYMQEKIDDYLHHQSTLAQRLRRDQGWHRRSRVRRPRNKGSRHFCTCSGTIGLRLSIAMI